MLSHSLKRYYAPLRLPIRPKMISLTPPLSFSFSRIGSPALRTLFFHSVPSLLSPENSHEEIRCLIREITAFPSDHRVGVFDSSFEATSRFTFVTARCFGVGNLQPEITPTLLSLPTKRTDNYIGGTLTH